MGVLYKKTVDSWKHITSRALTVHEVAVVLVLMYF